MSDLRRIETGLRRQLPPEEVRAGAVPQLQWVDLDLLRIDDSFQRPLTAQGWTAIDRITQKFSWAMFTPVVIAPIAGGFYSLIDGQHRCHAAQIAGFTSVPAMIVQTAEAGQAAAFAAINGNVLKMNSFSIYKAALMAGVEWAIRARDAVDAAGCVLLTYNKSTREVAVGDLKCINEIRGHVEKGRSGVVTAGLKAIRVQPDATPAHFSTNVLNPWFYALQEVGPGALDADLEAFCAEHDLLKLRDAMTVIAKRPDIEGNSPALLMKQSLTVLLRRHIGANVRPPVVAGEAAIGARMAEIAAQERKAQRRAVGS